MNNLFKKIGIITFSFLFIYSIGFYSFVAKAQTNAIGNGSSLPIEQIKNYTVDLTINKDASLRVSETIDYEFGNEERHGIYRYIPYSYKARGGNFKLRLSDVSVTDDANRPIQFQQSTSGANFELKIGDPEHTITGEHIYKINYTVNRAINYFDDHEELYWNVIGSGWEIPIEKSSAVVHAPANVIRMLCYTGPVGSQDQSCTINGGNTTNVTFTSTKQLGNGDGLTIVAAVPVGTIEKPTMLQKFWYIFLDNGVLLIPIFVFFILLWLWKKYGKDPKSKNPIVAQYQAPYKMSAMYMGTMLHSKTTNQDISAELIYLAANGYLKINKVEKEKLFIFKGTDYEFTKLSKDESSLAPQSKVLLDALFKDGKTTIQLSDLKGDTDFGQSLRDLRTDTYDELSKADYFKKNSSIIATLLAILGLIVAIGGSFLLGTLIGYIGVIAALATGIMMIIFGFIMPSVTQKGADTINLIKGLKLYLSVAEKDRLNFHNAPELNPQHFESLLPFAIALGVEKAWAAQFKDLTNAPSWYSDSSGGAFNSMLFASALSDFSSSVQSVATYTSNASSGGSGFSGGGGGGGFGGGGGGSW